MNVQHNIIEATEERRLRWFVNLKRMGSEKILKIKLEWNAEGKRIMGLRRRRIRKDLTEENAEGRKFLGEKTFFELKDGYFRVEMS